jgi:hypothetical protein
LKSTIRGSRQLFLTTAAQPHIPNPPGP